MKLRKRMNAAEQNELQNSTKLYAIKLSTNELMDEEERFFALWRGEVHWTFHW